MRAHRCVWGVWLATCGAGCSSADNALMKLDSGLAEADATDGAVFDSATQRDPAWWRLDARLVVSAGQLSAAGSELEVHIVDDAGGTLCSEVVRIASTDTMPSQPDPSILTWWAVTRGEGTGACVGLVDWEELPLTLYLGVGALHAELEAVAGQVEGLPEGTVEMLNGAYAQLSPDAADTWVYGFAGDAEAWAGTAGPATVTPLSDGVWTLTGVYGFPLP